MRNESTSWSICRIRIMTIFFTRTISKYQKQNVLHQNCGEKKEFNLSIKCVSLNDPLANTNILRRENSSSWYISFLRSFLFTQIQVAWACFQYDIDLNSQNSSDFTLLFVPRSHFLAPTFWSPCRQWFGRVFARSPLLLVCQLRLVLIFTHKQKQETQTCKIKKKKTIKTNYDKNICLYICVHLYIKDGMGHVEKLRWIKEHDVWNTITFGN